MLPSLIRIIPKSDDTEPAAEDIFTSSLGLIFTDDSQNFYGDNDALVAYKSRKLGRELILQTADVNGETERTKFAHYVWNAGIFMAELVGGRPDGISWRDDSVYEHSDPEAGHWWLTEEEQRAWSVTDETVLELGAGVGLGGISSALNGASTVVISDYPAPTILQSIRANVVANVSLPVRDRVRIEGHIWGDLTSAFAASAACTFSHVLAADCLWMPHEHANLAASMAHFLSKKPEARVRVIAGLHTGRANVAAFFREAAPGVGLVIESIWECNLDGARRPWRDEAAEDHVGERKKWLVVANLRRSTH